VEEVELIGECERKESEEEEENGNEERRRNDGESMEDGRMLKELIAGC
jgi:hypothetical protein